MVLSIYKLKFHSRKTLNNVLFHAIEFVIIRVLTNANNDTAPNIFATTLCVFPYTSIHRRLWHKKTAQKPLFTAPRNVIFQSTKWAENQIFCLLSGSETNKGTPGIPISWTH